MQHCNADLAPGEHLVSSCSPIVVSKHDSSVCIVLVNSGCHSCKMSFMLLRSGPVRYDCVHGDWVYARDGHLMHDRLEAEFSDLMDGPVSLSRPSSGASN